MPEASAGDVAIQLVADEHDVVPLEAAARQRVLEECRHGLARTGVHGRDDRLKAPCETGPVEPLANFRLARDAGVCPERQRNRQVRDDVGDAWHQVDRPRLDRHVRIAPFVHQRVAEIEGDDPWSASHAHQCDANARTRMGSDPGV
jgi:hypothetical protein